MKLRMAFFCFATIVMFCPLESRSQEAGMSVELELPVVPVTIGVDSANGVYVKVDGKIRTPIGAVSIGVGVRGSKYLTVKHGREVKRYALGKKEYRFDVPAGAVLEIDSAGNVTVDTMPSYVDFKWRFSSGHKHKIWVKLFSQSPGGHIWPSSGRSFVLDDDKQHSFEIRGKKGEKVCYGAWDSEGSYWGVGKDDKQSCEKCCVDITDGGSLTKTLGSDTKRAPVSSAAAVASRFFLTWAMKKVLGNSSN